MNAQLTPFEKAIIRALVDDPYAPRPSRPVHVDLLSVQSEPFPKDMGLARSSDGVRHVG